MSATSGRPVYIERYEVLNIINDAIAHNALSYEGCTNEIVESIARIPAADVRPVVLCKDCKHKGWVQEPEHGKSVDYCRLIERCVDKQFFCAAGEKREES